MRVFTINSIFYFDEFYFPPLHLKRTHARVRARHCVPLARTHACVRTSALCAFAPFFYVMSPSTRASFASACKKNKIFFFKLRSLRELYSFFFLSFFLSLLKQGEEKKEILSEAIPERSDRSLPVFH